MRMLGHETGANWSSKPSRKAIRIWNNWIFEKVKEEEKFPTNCVLRKKQFLPIFFVSIYGDTARRKGKFKTSPFFKLECYKKQGVPMQY